MIVNAVVVVEAHRIVTAEAGRILILVMENIDVVIDVVVIDTMMIKPMNPATLHTIVIVVDAETVRDQGAGPDPDQEKGIAVAVIVREEIGVKARIAIDLGRQIHVVIETKDVILDGHLGAPRKKITEIEMESHHRTVLLSVIWVCYLHHGWGSVLFSLCSLLM
jgi:hypothetical protein